MFLEDSQTSFSTAGKDLVWINLTTFNVGEIA